MNTMDNETIKIGLVIMASGLGKRFGSNKLMEELDSKPLIKWVIDVTDNLFYKRVVVTRSIDVKELCDNLNICCIYHELPDRNDTVRLGLTELIGDIDYCFFMQGDQPLIKKTSVNKLLDYAKNNNDKIVRACFNDTVGSPIGFPRQFFNDLLSLPTGKGGNYVTMNNLSFVITVSLQDEFELWDVDTVEDLENIKKLLDIGIK